MKIVNCTSCGQYCAIEIYSFVECANKECSNFTKKQSEEYDKFCKSQTQELKKYFASEESVESQMEFDWNNFAEEFNKAFDATFNIDLDDDEDGA